VILITVETIPISTEALEQDLAEAVKRQIKVNAAEQVLTAEAPTALKMTTIAEATHQAEAKTAVARTPLVQALQEAAVEVLVEVAEAEVHQVVADVADVVK
jgi:hypothetical protein